MLKYQYLENCVFIFLRFVFASLGDKIFAKGDDGSIFYMIKDGSVRISDFGIGSQFKDHSIGPGSYFGERALMTGEPRVATASAEGAVVLLALERSSFDTLLGSLKDVLDQNMNSRILESIKLFSNLGPSERNKVVKAFTLETYNTDTPIITEGEQGQKFYIIKSGLCKVKAKGQEVGELQQGAYFGELALMDNDVRKATVVAAQRCECFVLDRKTFQQIVASVRGSLESEANMRQKAMAESAAAQAASSIKYEDLKTLAVLGSGTFGRVTLVQDTKSKNVYALKAMLKKEIVAHKQQGNVLQEKHTMIQCFHPFILRLYTTFKSPSSLFMLLEFVQGGELFSVLHTSTRDGVPDAQAKFYGAAVISGLIYLHSKEIAYRDMKPENCLIDSQGYPKIVDFGFAKVITGKTYTLCGTPEYLCERFYLLPLSPIFLNSCIMFCIYLFI